MRISYNWLKEYVDITLTPQQLADRLTMAGLEVEGLEYLGEGIKGVVVGRIVSMKPHPSADRLTLCEVDTGTESLPVVCGARNMKEGDKVPLATVGAELPGGMKIEKAELRGVASSGMLCSEKELGLAKESAGLMILPQDAKVGEDIVKALGLDDWALEVNVTPNRPDCLSVVGIAREAAALTRKKLKLPQAKLKEKGPDIKGLAGVEIKDAELCPRYAGRLVRGVKAGGSPEWMKRRLAAVGLRSINNVVDVTNYVMMELGQPLHAFDYDLLEGHRIIVRTAAEGEKFTTLDGVERTLPDNTLMICDAARPVAIAGVMGGQNSEVGPSTVNVFLESAYFSPSGIRRAAKKLGLHTEASHRFERGMDPEGLILALDRAAGLIAELGGGAVVPGRADEYPVKAVMPEVAVRTRRVNEILGTDLHTDEMTDILGRLQVRIKDMAEGSFTAQAPTFRPDLVREADMVEEVARLHGYGKIRSRLPVYGMAERLQDRPRDASLKVKDALMNAGFTEVVNYSFINPADFDRLGLPQDDYRRKVITLQNPLSVEQSVMRTTLLPSLLGNLVWNFSRGVRDIKIFELSKVFLSEGPGLPREPLRVAGLAVGGRSLCLWDGRERSVGYYDLKGVVETVLDTMRVKGTVFAPADDVPFLHPGKSAWLMVGGSEAGFLGQLHPDVVERCDLPVEAFVFELDLQSLIEMEAAEPKYSPLPKFPPVERDVAVVVPADVSSFSVTKTIESLKVELIEDVKLFDYYEGKPIPEGKKSLAYTITYRSPARTLTDDEVNAVHQIVVDALKDRLGAEIRE
ncbi:MAG TPA: phenylalanine--tRNA ligase subunit beta [Nitrospirota bacterium]|nr:phenylalanine--tRNA ligase subunit beta [Nitrospirota bacterium]